MLPASATDSWTTNKLALQCSTWPSNPRQLFRRWQWQTISNYDKIASQPTKAAEQCRNGPCHAVAMRCHAFRFSRCPCSWEMLEISKLGVTKVAISNFLQMWGAYLMSTSLLHQFGHFLSMSSGISAVLFPAKSSEKSLGLNHRCAEIASIETSRLRDRKFSTLVGNGRDM